MDSLVNNHCMSKGTLKCKFLTKRDWLKYRVKVISIRLHLQPKKHISKINFEIRRNILILPSIKADAAVVLILSAIIAQK